MEHKSNVTHRSLDLNIQKFWMDEPKLWFIRTEAVFNVQNIENDNDKYYIVLEALEKEAFAKIIDTLLNPPDTGKYEMLKSRLLSIYEEPSSRKLQKLINETQAGQIKPSRLYRKMREFLGDKIPDDMLQVLWQGYLSQTVRTVLAIAECEDIEIVAAIADEIMESSKPPQVAKVPQYNKDIDALVAEVAKLSMTITDFEVERGRSLRRKTNQNRRRSMSRSRNRLRDSSDWLCFYHYRFQDRARSCVLPCAWKKKNDQQGN